MLHLFLGKGPWFRAKSYGFGTGLPFKWQGWALIVAHVGVLVGIALAMPTHSTIKLVLLLLATVAPLPIYRARTEGGWRWRMGGADEDKGPQNG